MSVDFIHCNQCLIRSDSRIVFHLSECAKIFCQSCVENTSSKSCPNCCPNVCQTIPLVNGIKPEIELYFRDISHSFKKLSNAESFQKSQRKHLFEALFNKIKTLENENCQFKARQKHLENELKKKDNELHSIKCENNELKSVINSRVHNNINETLNNGALRQPKTDKKVSFSRIFGFNNENKINTNPMQTLTETHNEFSSTCMNTIERLDNGSEYVRSDASSRSRISLSQSCSLMDDKQPIFSSQLHRKESNALNNYTPISINSMRSRSSATINTPFSVRSYSSASHSSFRNISPMIFGYRPNKDKVVQRVIPYSPF